MYRLFLILIIVLFFSGCSNKVINSTMDLNNEFEVKWGFTGSPNQLKQMSLNGLSPISNVGEFYYIKPSNGLQSAVMLKRDDFVKEKDFLIHTSYYDSETNMDDLINIKTLMSKLEEYSSTIVKLKLEELVQAAKKISIKKEIQSVSNQISTISDAEKLKVLNENKEALNDELILEKSKSKINIKELLEAEFKVEKELKDLVSKLEKDETKKDELEKARKELKTSSNKIYSLLDIYGISAYEILYNKLYGDYLEATKRKNIFVFKWNIASDKSALANATSYISANAKSKKEKSGYIIASGITVQKLVPSKEFIQFAEDNAATSNYGSMWSGQHVGVVTYTLKAENLVSFVSEKRETLLKLLASLNDIQHFSQDIKKITNIELELSSLSISDFSSFSHFTKPKVGYINGNKEKNKLPEKIFSSLEELKKVEARTLEDYIDGITIFSVITESANLGDIYENKSKKINDISYINEDTFKAIKKAKENSIKEKTDSSTSNIKFYKDYEEYKTEYKRLERNSIFND